MKINATAMRYGYARSYGF